MIKRSKTLKRTPVKRRRSGVRRGPWRSREFRGFISEQCCALWLRLLEARKSGAEITDEIRLGARCRTPTFVDPAHTENNGMSSKGPDSSCAPLCRQHHLEYDANREAFETKYAVDMKAIAAQYYQQWLSEGNIP